MNELAHHNRTGNTLPFDRSRLDAILEPVARAHGAEVVDVEFKSEQGGWVLRLFVEKLGSADARASSEDSAISLALCADVARDLSPALDVADIIPHRYNLEVSSPGVERALKTPRDFVRFEGKKAKFKFHNAVSGQKVLVGILGPLENDTLTVREGERAHRIALDNISSARLVFEFGPQPKPGKGPSLKKKHSK